MGKKKIKPEIKSRLISNRRAFGAPNNVLQIKFAKIEIVLLNGRSAAYDVFGFDPYNTRCTIRIPDAKEGDIVEVLGYTKRALNKLGS